MSRLERQQGKDRRKLQVTDHPQVCVPLSIGGGGDGGRWEWTRKECVHVCVYVCVCVYCVYCVCVCEHVLGVGVMG